MLGERECFLEVILEEVMSELGFETHRGRPGGGRLGKQGRGLLPEDVRSRAVWAGHMHWLPLAPGAMMKNQQAWRCACSVVRRQDQHQESMSDLTQRSLRCPRRHCCEEAVRAERRIELDGTLWIAPGSSFP